MFFLDSRKSSVIAYRNLFPLPHGQGAIGRDHPGGVAQLALNEVNGAVKEREPQ
jgi:hypothetical protein